MWHFNGDFVERAQGEHKNKWMLFQPSETKSERARKAEMTHYNLSGQSDPTNIKAWDQEPCRKK